MKPGTSRTGDGAETHLDEIRALVQDAVRRASIADNVVDIDLESVQDEYGDPFLRILVQVKNLSQFDDGALEAFLEEVETSVSAHDDRYASVRFSDAA